MVFIGCAQSPASREENTISEFRDEIAKASKAISFHVPEGEDPGLSLYRKPTTHARVYEFYMNLTGSDEITKAILHYADVYDIPLSLAFSLSWEESKFYPNAVNKNYDSIDRGLFQLNSKSFPHLKREDFYDPKINTFYGLRYLRTCLDEGGNEVVALAMYNAGRSRVKATGTPQMTLDYISRILNYQKKIEQDFKTHMLASKRVTGTKPEKKIELLLDKKGGK